MITKGVQVNVCPVAISGNAMVGDVAGVKYVIVQIASPTGLAVYFFEPAAAAELGAGLVELAKRASSGLVLPDAAVGF